MQNYKCLTVGVSPAYFVSGYGTGFSRADVERELSALSSMGFGSVQFEVFEREMLEGWEGLGYKSAFSTASETGIKVSAFVAHFVGHYFASSNEDCSGAALSDFSRVLEILDTVDNEVPAAVPLLPHKGKEPADKAKTADLLALMNRKAAEHGRDFIIEIVPASAAGSYSEFIESEPWKQTCSEIGFLLDTGHANVTGENIPQLIDRMGDRLKALHLSDNDGKVNLSLKPGDGSLDWNEITASLYRNGYKGSFDLEIVADKTQLESEYKKGRLNITKMIEQQSLLKELI